MAIMALSTLRKMKAALVDTYYPNLTNEEEREKKIEEVMYDLDGALYIEKIFPKAALDRIKYFQPREGDVMIAVYPRCGKHLFTALTNMVLEHNNLDELCKPEVMDIKQKIMEFRTKEGPLAIDNMAQRPGRRVLPTHLLTQHADIIRMMMSSPLKVIHVVRDFRDAITSMYHLVSNVLCGGNFKVPFEDFYHMVLEMEKPRVYPCWLDHGKQWLEIGRQFEDRYLLLKYEDLHHNRAGVVRKVAKFCDVELSDDLVEEIVDRTSFNNTEKLFNWPGRLSTTIVKLELARKGTVNDWETVFTPKTQKAFEELVKCTEPYKTLYGNNVDK